MMAEENVSPSNLPAPSLSAPIEGKAIESSAVTFRWEQLDDAASYQLQIAEDERFEELLLNVDVGDVQARTVKGAFQEYDKDYFWRVRARDEQGAWGPYSAVSRFVIASEEHLDAIVEQAERPEEAEEKGPVGELVKAAGLEAAAQVTGDEELEEEAHEMGVEEEGIAAKQIVMITAITLFIILALIVVMFWIYTLSTSEISGRAAAGVEYPELREHRTEATRQLSQYDVVDREAEVYRIPVDRAIELVVQERNAGESAVPLPQDAENEQ